jgi:hypothetical protein
VKAEPDLAEVPVLGFCGHRENMRREAALAAGADRVVTNSSVATELAALIEAITTRPVAGRTSEQQRDRPANTP